MSCNLIFIGALNTVRGSYLSRFSVYQNVRYNYLDIYWKYFSQALYRSPWCSGCHHNCLSSGLISKYMKYILGASTREFRSYVKTANYATMADFQKKYSRKCNKYIHVSECFQGSSANKSDETKRIRRTMEELRENILTVPNVLCVTRIIVTPFLGYLVLQELYAISLGLFIFAGCTDFLDGYIARTFPGQQSMIGSFLDPAADKLLVATLFLTLTINGLIPLPLTCLIILRDVCLLGAGFYIRYVSLPPPKSLSRYFDASFATARLSPTMISKVNTLVQFSLVGISLASPIFGYVDHFYLKVLWCITGASTIVSAGSYLYYKDTYKLTAQQKYITRIRTKGS